MSETDLPNTLNRRLSHAVIKNGNVRLSVKDRLIFRKQSPGDPRGPLGVSHPTSSSEIVTRRWVRRRVANAARAVSASAVSAVV